MKRFLYTAFLLAIVVGAVFISCKTSSGNRGGANPCSEWNYHAVKLSPNEGCCAMWGEGYGEIRSSGYGRARELAIEDAKRDAIQRLLGFYLTHETVEESGLLIADEAFSRAGGTIYNYEVLEERQRDDIQSVYVKLEANIFIQPIQEAIQVTAQEILAKMKYPVVVVVNYETIEGRANTTGEGIAGGQLAQQFKDAGYTVRDLNMAPAAERTALLNALKTSNQAGITAAAINLGRAMGARVVVASTATVNNTGPVSYGGQTYENMISFQASVLTKAILSDNGEILGAAQSAGRIVDRDANIGAQKSIQRALVDAGGFTQLSNNIMTSWIDIKRNGTWINLYVTGVDILEARNVVTAIDAAFQECTEADLIGQTTRGINIRVRWRYGGDGISMAQALRDKGARFPYTVTLGDVTQGEVYCALQKKN